jgi:hypothetical protein
MKNHETKTGWKRSPEAPHHLVAQAPLLAAPPCGESTPNFFPSRFPPVILFQYLIFAYITPRISRDLYIVFSSCFCFDLFLLGVFLNFRGIMASVSNDKEKTPPEDDHQDSKLKEEVESEAKEEEME